MHYYLVCNWKASGHIQLGVGGIQGRHNSDKGGTGQGGRGKWDSDQPDQDEAILNPRLVSQNHPKVETFVHNRQQNVTLPDLIFTVPKILSFVKKKMGACYRFSGQEIYW